MVALCAPYAINEGQEHDISNHKEQAKPAPYLLHSMKSHHNKR